MTPITGKELWAYSPTLGYCPILCCGQQGARGVAVAYGKVFAAQLDGHVVALDARPPANSCGKTDHARRPLPPSPLTSIPSTMAGPSPITALILVGNAGGGNGRRGGFLEAPGCQYRQAGVALQHHPRRPISPGGKDMEPATAGNMAAARCGTRPAIDVKNNLILFATGKFPNPDLERHQPARADNRLHQFHCRHRFQDGQN